MPLAQTSLFQGDVKNLGITLACSVIELNSEYQEKRRGGEAQRAAKISSAPPRLCVLIKPVN